MSRNFCKLFSQYNFSQHLFAQNGI